MEMVMAKEDLRGWNRHLSHPAIQLMRILRASVPMVYRQHLKHHLKTTLPSPSPSPTSISIPISISIAPCKIVHESTTCNSCRATTRRRFAETTELAVGVLTALDVFSEFDEVDGGAKLDDD